MQVSDSKRGDIFPRDVTVRPVRGYAEQRRWDALAARHHYLAFKYFYGRAIRHLAVSGEAWVALIGWQAGAFKVGVRDAWIGWTRDQRFSRLHLVANNTRFVILGEGCWCSSKSAAIPLNPLVRVRVDFPHPLGPATTRRVGIVTACGRAGRISQISGRDS